jgi:beta-glucosidase
MTLNEPQCFVGLGHSTGTHAPGLTANPGARCSRCCTARWSRTGARCSGSVRTPEDHKIGWAPVGVTGFPDTESPEDIEATRKFMFERCAPGDGWSFSNALYADPVILGSTPTAPTARPSSTSCPTSIHADDLAVISQPLDFYGVNIYQGTRVKAGPDGEPVALPYPPGTRAR